MTAAQHIGGPAAHPAAELFPMLSDNALEPIVESMRMCGFDPEHPILRYRGLILDGKNRFRAAAMAGVEPIFKDLADDVNPYQESWKHNGSRRDLTPGQKAGILVKIRASSAAWRKEQEERQRRANEARAEKANARRAENGRLTSGASRDASQVKRPDGHAAAVALAVEAGVSRPTVERALRLARENPEKLEAVIRGEKTKRKKPVPRPATEQRNAEILRLHEEGLGTMEIARRLDLKANQVSHSKTKLGIAENSAPIKLWSDIDHVATTLEGAALKLEQLTEQLAICEVNATAQEIRTCIKSLSRSGATVGRLRRALKRKLP